MGDDRHCNVTGADRFGRGDRCIVSFTSALSDANAIREACKGGRDGLRD